MTDLKNRFYVTAPAAAARCRACYDTIPIGEPAIRLDARLGNSHYYSLLLSLSY